MNVFNILVVLLTSLTGSNLVHSASLFESKGYDLSHLNSQQQEDSYQLENVKPLFENNKSTFLPPEKRPSFKDRLRRAMQKSPSSSPRTSESSTSSSSSSSPRGSSLRNSLNKLWRSSNSSRDSDESDISRHVRSAFSDEQGSQIIWSLIDFESVQPIDWEDIVAEPSLPRALESKFNEIIAFSKHNNDAVFVTKVRKALHFIKFPLNQFVLHLCIVMVEKYDTKAPSALKLFLESRFSVMRQIDQGNFAKSVEFYVTSSPGYNAELFKDENFINHVESLFLDTFTKADNLYDFTRNIDILFITYMELFRNVTIEADFLKRVAVIVKILMKIGAEEFPGAIVNNNRIETILKGRFNIFEGEVNKMFGYQ